MLTPIKTNDKNTLKNHESQLRITLHHIMKHCVFDTHLVNDISGPSQYIGTAQVNSPLHHHISLERMYGECQWEVIVGSDRIDNFFFKCSMSFNKVKVKDSCVQFCYVDLKVCALINKKCDH